MQLILNGLISLMLLNRLNYNQLFLYIKLLEVSR